jgi:flagellin
MSSLLTNNSAMVALQTIRKINTDMTGVQSEISTGKKIANARDNAAIWGISTTMQSDVSGFKAISESLSLGSATLSVGRDAAETVASLLDNMKGKIVAAQEENVDRGKIQEDVKALRDQITTVVDAAQFNGLNVLKGRDEVSILASLNRDNAGMVTASHITFNQQDLTTSAGVLGAGAALTSSVSATTVGATANTATVTVGGTPGATGGAISFTLAGETVSFTMAGSGAGGTVASGGIGLRSAINANANLAALGITASDDGSGVVTINSVNAFTEFTVAGASNADGTTVTLTDAALERRAETVTLSAATLAENDSFEITLGDAKYTYVAGEGEDLNDVARGLKTLIDSAGDSDVSVQVNAAADPTSTNVTLYVDNAGADITNLAVTGAGDGTKAGGLRGLEAIDVTTAEGAKGALVAIEGLIQNAISAAAAFGSSQGRIDTQTEFVSKIMDGLTSGIGALVDADMEAASARLQALQVQQQLGVQALSIANQQPQNILALFR